MNKENEKRIISVCNTCRLPIYLGEPIYNSSDSKRSGLTTGVYGGNSLTRKISKNSGLYIQNTDQTHNQETWNQCFRCYDEWIEEKRIKSEWDKKLLFWSGMFFFPILIFGTMLNYFLFGKTISLNDFFNMIIGSAIWAFIIGCILGYIVNYLKNGSVPKVDRYRIRKNKN